MLFLDTNAFYYAAGISTTSINLPELMKLISENETCISVVSLHEFLVKFRNDVGIIKTGLQFLADHHIKTAYNKFFPKPKIWNISMWICPRVSSALLSKASYRRRLMLRVDSLQ